jgi:lipoprotein NlpI
MQDMIAHHLRGARRGLHAALIAASVLATPTACDRSSRDAAAMTSAGVTHLQQGEYDRAIRDFDRAIAMQPGLVVAWRQRGVAHTAKGDYDRAVADYDQALVFAPNDPRLHADRGAVLVLLNDYDRALRAFDRALSIKPDHAGALEHRGRTHFILGNWAQAAADLQRGLNPTEPNPRAAFWLHLARQRLKQDDRSDFASYVTPSDTAWPAPITRFFTGEIRSDSLLRLVAADTTDSLRECEAAFYLGEDAVARGQTDSAAVLLRESVARCPKERGEYRAAAAELRRLGR